LFCPTYLVTKPVFNFINSDNQYLMVTGQYGVGKSWAFFLYFLLNDIIYRYRHKYCKDIKDLPEEIDNTIPKTIYYSLSDLHE
jgi:hypothetical protein